LTSVAAAFDVKADKIERAVSEHRVTSTAGASEARGTRQIISYPAPTETEPRWLSAHDHSAAAPASGLHT